MAQNNSKIYSVSQLNSLIKGILADNLPPRLSVAGEITDWKIYASGHCYFSLKDESSVLPCVMWASKFKTVKFEPENGMAVIATGYIDVYQPHGKYQFYVESMQPEGVGALQLAFEQMKAKLQKEGLFKDEYKKPLPPYPKRIGIITSESGAAVHDIADSIFNRWPAVELFLYPTAVQGEGAAKQIADAIAKINKANKNLKLDLLIVGRGGGSMEDLWAFNEEVLARAIFASDIPVISAVGHEVDITIADMVADARASTPTKASVIAVPDAVEVLGSIEQLKKRFSMDIESKMTIALGQIEKITASAVFRYPLSIIQNQIQTVDNFQSRLTENIRTLFERVKARLANYFDKILTIEPHRLMGAKKIRITNLKNTLEKNLGDIITQDTFKLKIESKNIHSAFDKLITRKHTELTAVENRLGGLNPKKVLNRGYSITTNKRTGKVLLTAEDAQLGDMIITELKQKNLIESQVKKK